MTKQLYYFKFTLRFIITSLFQYFNQYLFTRKSDFKIIKAKKLNDYRENKKIDNVLFPFYDDLGTMKVLLEYENKLFSSFNVKYFYVLSAVDNIIKFEKFKFFSKILFKFIHSLNIKRLINKYGINKSDYVGSNFLWLSLHNSPMLLANKEKILETKHKNILIGDLIYDTYLRYKNKATLELKDIEFWRIYYYSFNLVDYWYEFFKSNDFKIVFLPYSSYIHWGIPSRVALNLNIKVITFGSMFYHLSDLSEQFPYHTKNYNDYRGIFKNLKNKNQLIMEAKIRIDKRINGSVDEIPYMKTSSFNNIIKQEYIVSKSKFNAFIFLHCFFDSPHVYGNLVFPDFYEWLTNILEIASSVNETTFYVKPHPNGLIQNDVIVNNFKIKYEGRNIIFLPKELSNNIIVKLKPNAIFTVYGTVGHEFAYLGIPVINAGQNPHVNYNFNYNPKTFEEFRFFVQNVGNFNLPEKYDVNDILEFYYMHYMYYSPYLDCFNSNTHKDFENGKIELPVNVTIDELTFK